MESDFELDGSILKVRAEGEGFKPVLTPAGFQAMVFRNAVATVFTLFVRDGKTPSVAQMYEAYPRIPVKTWAELILTDEFKQALGYRGVEWDANQGLSLEQNMALMKLTDPTDRRATGTKLKELAIPYGRYQAWMRQPHFSNAYKVMSENNLKDAIPVAINKLISNMEAGDQRAIEKTLEISGRYNPAQMQLEDANAVVMRVIESVIKNVKDADIRRAILDDIEKEAVVFAMTNRRALEG